MISASFHSSSKSHSISSAAALAKAERHNSRGYFSLYYDKDKISNLVGQADRLSDDVKDAINQTFADMVSAYNEKQKRKDRKISSAFEHFNSNKKLDLAVESILQIGDQEFWSRFRTDTVVYKNGKQYILKKYPEEVKKVMDEIFKHQLEAYEKIYDTHGDVIARKIAEAYNTSFKTAQDMEQVHPEFKEIFEMAPKERTQKLNELDPETQTQFVAYYDARNTMASIVESKLGDRIKNKQMHIKVVSAAGHYDEWSPHAHGISLVYADGYTKGLSSRVSKSIVLNRWAMEVIQDRMHEIAEQEIQKHPEIFENEKIKEKTKGRNFDYTTEQITRQNLAKLDEKVLKTTAYVDTNEEIIKQQEEQMYLIQTYEQYCHEVNEVSEQIEVLETLAIELEPNKADWIRQVFEKIWKIIEACLTRLHIYEGRHPHMDKRSELVEKRAATLEEKIFGATQRAMHPGTSQPTPEQER